MMALSFENRLWRPEENRKASIQTAFRRDEGAAAR